MALRRPPAHVRTKVDIAYRIEDQSVVFFEIRPVWKKPESKVEISIAKTTYVKKQKVWKVYWQRQDPKWHGYEPCPEVKYLEEFLSLVHEDTEAYFWGLTNLTYLTAR
ncbi:MAG: hypothetical protein ACI9Y1_002081 [Lentisphaeria bacterium]|jgi:hypothetical protein